MNSILSITLHAVWVLRLRRWSHLMVLGLVLAACRGNELTACGDVDDQTLYTGERKALDVCFTGSEPSELVITGSSSNLDVGAVQVHGRGMTVVAIGPGNAAMTVQAEDPDGNTAQIQFKLEVPNQLPFATVAEMPTTNMLTRSRREYRVDEYFADDDGQPLFFDASIDDSTVADVIVEDSLTLVIDGGALGEAVVTLTATDPHGGVAQLRGQVRVVEPVLFWRDDFGERNSDWTFDAASYHSYEDRPGYLSGYVLYNYTFFLGERVDDDNAVEWLISMSVAAEKSSTNQTVGFRTSGPFPKTIDDKKFHWATLGETDSIGDIGETPGSNWQIAYFTHRSQFKVAAYGNTDGVGPVGEFSEMRWGVRRGVMALFVGETMVWSQNAVDGNWPLVHRKSWLFSAAGAGEKNQYVYFDWAELWAVDAYDDAGDVSDGWQVDVDSESYKAMWRQSRPESR